MDDLNTVAPSLEMLKLALGRMERATTRVELVLRGGHKDSGDAMTSSAQNTLEKGLTSAIDRIDALLKDNPNG